MPDENKPDASLEEEQQEAVGTAENADEAQAENSDAADASEDVSAEKQDGSQIEDVGEESAMPELPLPAPSFHRR